MSLYRRDAMCPEWEPVPWRLKTKAADEQERGFHQRALKVIAWTAIPWTSFPDAGLFDRPKDWLSSIDAACFATVDGEDMILIDNVWFGWPDPPRWGLASRRHGRADNPWVSWGHFSDLPATWTVPAHIQTALSSEDRTSVPEI